MDPFIEVLRHIEIDAEIEPYLSGKEIRQIRSSSSKERKSIGRGQILDVKLKNDTSSNETTISKKAYRGGNCLENGSTNSPAGANTGNNKMSASPSVTLTTSPNRIGRNVLRVVRKGNKNVRSAFAGVDSNASMVLLNPCA